jgi:hypothetical protein
MRARLESFQAAFAELKLNPSPEEFQEIGQIVHEEYSRCAKNVTGRAVAQAKSEGRAFDPSTHPVTAPAYANTTAYWRNLIFGEVALGSLASHRIAIFQGSRLCNNYRRKICATSISNFCWT